MFRNRSGLDQSLSAVAAAADYSSRQHNTKGVLGFGSRLLRHCEIPSIRIHAQFVCSPYSPYPPTSLSTMSPAQVISDMPHTPALAPAPVRAALDALRVAETYVALKRDTLSLLSSLSLHSGFESADNNSQNAPSETLSVCDPSTLDYVVVRLANGVSVSTGFIRANFAFGLYSILQNHPNFNAAVSRVLSIYSSPPDSSEGPSALREHALGALSSAAAVIAAGGSRLSLDESRGIIKILRVTLQPDHAKWCFSPAATVVLLRLLRVQPEEVRSQLVKPLWAICSARPQSEHSLTLALALLLDFRLVSPSAVHALYPSLDTPLVDALMSSCETGFSPFDSPLMPDPLGRKRPSTTGSPIIQDIVPHAWRLAFRYVASSSTNGMMEDVCSLWKKVIVGRLLTSKNSVSRMTKPLLAIQLLPFVIQNLARAPDVSMIIDERFSNVIHSLLRVAKVRSKSQPHRLASSSINIAPAVSHILCRVPREIATRVPSAENDDESGPDAFMIAFWRAIVNNSLGVAFGSSENLSQSFGLMSPTALKSVFSEGIATFAKLSSGTQKLSSGELEFRQTQALRFLLTLSRTFPSVKNDVIRALSLLAMFKPLSDKTSPHSENPSKQIISFDDHQTSDCFFSEAFSLSSQALSDRKAIEIYNRLMHLLIEKGSNLSHVKVCFDSFHLALNASAKVEARCRWKESIEPIQAQLNEIVNCATEKFQNVEDVVALNALKMLALHLGCELMDPTPLRSEIDSSAKGNNNEMPAETLDFVNRLIACFEVLAGRKPSKGGVMELDADNIERVSHLICVYVGRETAKISIGLQALECLGDHIDDRVVAVFFDVMDAYSEGIDRFDVMDESSDGTDEDIELNGVDQSGKADDDTDSDTGSSDPIGQNDTQAGLKNGVPKVTDGDVDQAADEGESDSDIDVEAEDEDTLKALDNHLSQHLRLLNEQKKLRKQQRGKRKGPVKVSKTLKLIEGIARSLRIRLDSPKSGKKDNRTVLVFLDVLVRLFEFTFSNEVDNLGYLDQVTRIVKKQICDVPPICLARHLSDPQSVLEISDRLFQAVINCKRKRILMEAHTKVLSVGLQLLMTVCVLASEKLTCSDFADNFGQLLKSILSDGGHVASCGLILPFLKLGGDSGLNLVKTIIKQLEVQNVSKTRRTKCAELLELMAKTIQTEECRAQASADGVASFWGSLEQFILSDVCTESLQGWNSSGLKCLLRAVSLGLKESSESGLDACTSTQFRSPEAVKSKLLDILKATKLETANDLESLAISFEMIPRKRGLGKRGPKIEKRSARKKPKRK